MGGVLGRFGHHLQGAGRLHPLLRLDERIGIRHSVQASFGGVQELFPTEVCGLRPVHGHQGYEHLKDNS